MNNVCCNKGIAEARCRAVVSTTYALFSTTAKIMVASRNWRLPQTQLEYLFAGYL